MIKCYPRCISLGYAFKYISIGPLTYTNDEKSYVVGVVSFGQGCGEVEYPGVYGRVTKAMDWIQEQLRIIC